MDEIRLKTKNGGTYIQFEDMKNIKDSMQIDSDTEICSYEAPDGKFKVTQVIPMRTRQKITGILQSSHRKLRILLLKATSLTAIKSMQIIITGLSYLSGMMRIIIWTPM